MDIDSTSFKNLKVLIIGDVMMDQYMFGQVYRNSPEADIPVLEDVILDRKIGGSANVALNVKQLGADVSILSVTGNDNNGSNLRSLIEEHGIKSDLITDSSRKTTVKTRVFSGTSQLVRVDQEDKFDLDNDTNDRLLAQLDTLLQDKKIDIAILQDYNKGVLNENNIARIIKKLKLHDIFIAVDPKVDNFLNYQNVDLFKPNLKELLVGTGTIDNNQVPSLDQIQKVAMALRTQIAAKTVLATLSDRGAMIVNKAGSYHQKPNKIEVVDVCGAGDAVIAIASMALFLGFTNKDIIALTNETGRIVCGKTGVVAIHINELNF